MKKPNITEGEWVFIEEEPIEEQRLYLVNNNKGAAIHDSFSKANAKAISAVPEMLDALMCFVKSKAGPNDCSKKAKQALKKAGVKL